MIQSKTVTMIWGTMLMHEDPCRRTSAKNSDVSILQSRRRRLLWWKYASSSMTPSKSFEVTNCASRNFKNLRNASAKTATWSVRRWLQGKSLSSSINVMIRTWKLLDQPMTSIPWITAYIVLHFHNAKVREIHSLRTIELQLISKIYTVVLEEKRMIEI